MIQSHLPNFAKLVHKRLEKFCESERRNEQSEQIKQFVQLASDYKLKKIDSMVELAREVMKLDGAIDKGSGIWQIFTDIIGSSSTARLQGGFNMMLNTGRLMTLGLVRGNAISKIP